MFKPIDWRCNLFSTGDREIRGEAVWIAPAEARINEHIWLRRLRLFFSIQGWSPSSEDKAEDLAGGLKYSPPWEAPELGLKHEAQIFIDLRVNSEQFADLWDRSPERLPQHVFIEIEGFYDQIWNLDAQESANVLVKNCTFQIAARLSQEDRIALSEEQIITDLPFFVEQRLRTYRDPQHRIILKELYGCITRELKQRGETYQPEIEMQFTEIENLVQDLDFALNREAIQSAELASSLNSPPNKPRWIWRGGNPANLVKAGPRSSIRHSLDRDALADIARRYLQMAYLRSDLLEWIIVDALVLYNIQEFGYTLKLWAFFRYFGILAGWIVGLAVLTPFAREGLLQAMVTFGVWVLFFMWLTGRPIFLNRWGRSNRLLLLEEMIRAYKLLEANLGVISTYSVRNALLELQNKGAAWTRQHWQS